MFNYTYSNAYRVGNIQPYGKWLDKNAAWPVSMQSCRIALLTGEWFVEA
jgi:hypothetical protein